MTHCQNEVVYIFLNPSTDDFSTSPLLLLSELQKRWLGMIIMVRNRDTCQVGNRHPRKEML